jgi:hypothetical protein
MQRPIGQRVGGEKGFREAEVDDLRDRLAVVLGDEDIRRL